LEDGSIALTAASAVASGISYHTSAANYGDGQYLVDNYHPGSGGFHNFDPAGSGALLNIVTVPPGGTLRCVLQWADPFGGSIDDYDLYVVEPVTLTVLASSRTVQNGSQNPVESLKWPNPLSQSVDVGIAIQLVAGAPVALKLMCPSSPSLPLEFASSRFGIFGQAAHPEVIAVAAISAKDPGLNDIEPYSSQGPVQIFFPTPVVRAKPDLGAFDDVTTTVPGFVPFRGTSAAAPHSAAVAALLLSKNIGIPPGQVQRLLTATAVDIGAAGFDSVAGFGRIDASAAINAVPATTTTTVPACTSAGCDDANPCTDDTCDPIAGCQHLANSASCSDGAQCTLGDRCSNGECQPGSPVTAGTVSTLITAQVNASVGDCRGGKRKQVKNVVNPLVQAAKAFSRAEVAGAGTKKWRKKVSAGEKSIGTARSKLTKVQPKLSPPCVADLSQAITAGALADACLH
jgi:Subtilase family